MSNYMILAIAFVSGFVATEIWRRKYKNPTFTRVIVVNKDGTTSQYFMEKGKDPEFDKALRKAKIEALYFVTLNKIKNFRVFKHG